MRIEKSVTVLDRPWEELIEGINQKYPNPHSKAAKTNDVLSRRMEDGLLVTEKWVGNKFPVPSIIRSTFLKCTGINFPEMAQSYEMTVIDREEGTLRQYSKNNSMAAFLSFVEVMNYKKISETETELTQTWKVQCDINSWFNSWFENQFVSTCVNNSKKGLDGLKWVTEKLHSGPDGLLDLHQFRESLKVLVDDIESTTVKVTENLKEELGEISQAVKETLESTENIVTDVAEESIQKVGRRIRLTSEHLRQDREK